MEDIKTILRFEKIKSYNDLNLANAHANRYSDTPNANTELTKYNKLLFGTNNMVKKLKSFFNEKGIKPRKGSVLAMDGMLTLSPNYFENKQNTIEFIKAAKEYLEETFGENLLSVHFHIDETSPHIHFYVIPMNQKGRLSAFDCFNKNTLPAFQKSYCEFMSKKLKLKLSYKEGSKAKHTTLKEYYKMVNDEVSPLKNEIEKLQKLENEVEELKTEVSKLKLFIETLKKQMNQLKDFFKKQNEKPLVTFDNCELPKLTPNNFPDIENELKKEENKQNRRLKRRI
ncbi:hypothetical protein VSVS12_02721 [Vibrio scophthalmi]|uniref:MobV family relaxase n=1 Tax=Vibrio scophthalmi TaxID=45658 RepID=UPI0008098F14|nr:MobV family relaxase [Vibrio scophthalmi]ANS86470.1 hypothetical protein VSVS12_02721 [Vibrio scophthalmi]